MTAPKLGRIQRHVLTKLYGRHAAWHTSLMHNEEARALYAMKLRGFVALECEAFWITEQGIAALRYYGLIPALTQGYKPRRYL